MARRIARASGPRIPLLVGLVEDFVLGMMIGGSRTESYLKISLKFTCESRDSACLLRRQLRHGKG
jgi:hypothetical protein